MALDLRQNVVSVQYLGNKWTEFHQILFMHSYCQHLSWGCYTSFFAHFVPELWPLIYSKISFPLNIVRTNGQILTKLYITIYTDKIYVGIVNCHFLHICTSVMTLDLRQNFVSVQYLENKWTEFYLILYMHSYLTRSTLGLLHIIFRTFGPYSKNWFPINILRTNGQILTKLYITIYTDKIYVGIVSCHFLQVSKRVLALD